MLSNILIAIGFFGFGILVGLGLAAYAIKSGKLWADTIKTDESVMNVYVLEK